ncbi:hypothetical protein CK203_106855 [Vitis vinifera]|uniref:AAA+ ATPase domain-containing protein n=1 Tax=Vitis vinifera TaxID=29760 RepID=A0A438CX43_VITVI|nr:hypothetical protein CK203_106855 [Vitis vinifera]
MSIIPGSRVSSDFQKFNRVSPSTGVSNSTTMSNHSHGHGNGYSQHTEKQKKLGRSHGTSFAPTSASFSSNRLRSCDVFIGLHGRKPPLLRFANWLRAELEVQGMSCFVSDRARCRNSRKHGIVERAMDVSTFGLDIVEKRGEMWEKHGGELWLLYGGLENEWKEAVNGLSRVDDWKLEAQDGKWRDCILRAVTLLAIRLGRRSVVERLTKWREKAEKEEFPFPRNENFIGRKKELSELEFILFGDLRKRRREQHMESGHRKGKQAVVWKESEKEIEMQSSELPQRQYSLRSKNGGKYGRSRRSAKILYGKGIACVSGESGIGKTDLLLEFAYRYHQRYKMVLWVGGGSRYIRQNYLNLWSFLEVDVGIENCLEKSRIKSFEEHEEAAISRVRKELMAEHPIFGSA